MLRFDKVVRLCLGITTREWIFCEALSGLLIERPISVACLVPAAILNRS